jgi:hypothetical protein
LKVLKGLAAFEFNISLFLDSYLKLNYNKKHTNGKVKMSNLKIPKYKNKKPINKQLDCLNNLIFFFFLAFFLVLNIIFLLVVPYLAENSAIVV